MGTGSDSTDIKEEAKKRSHVMAKLYRGSLDILRSKHDALANSLITHVRSFDRPIDESDYSYVESLGFWRMLVELIFQVYTQLSLCIGIILVVLLVICAWPIRFLIEMFAGSWFLSKQQYTYDSHQHTPPTLDPVEDEAVADGKVVRRVVYEEAKVPKK